MDSTRPTSAPTGTPAIQRGLAGVYFDSTQISNIDGVAGKLSYRGRDIADLVTTLDLIDLAYLLVEGRAAPDQERAIDAQRIASMLSTPATLPPFISSRPIDPLRIALALTEIAGDTPASGRDMGASHALRVVARVAAALADYIKRCERSETRASDEHFIATMRGAISGMTGDADPNHVRAFQRAIVVLAEHGSSASSFAARVATSTNAPPSAALMAACCTFEGPLHGGAIQNCMGALESIGQESAVADWIKALRARNTPIPGFGHRVYRTEDPRVALLRAEVISLASATGKISTGLAIADRLCDEMSAMRRLGIAANVDLYAAALLRDLGAPVGFAIPIFSLARIIGWCAHIREQAQHNILIRPLLYYRA
jgi:citrate synthase